MNKLTLLLATAAVALIAADSYGSETVTRRASPNVVVIVADDLRYDELGCTGHAVIKTPTLDALAREGALFHRCYATSSWCTPSRVTLMTGRWHSATAVGTGNRALSREQWAESLPMILKRAGYFTGLIGKINVPGVRQSQVDFYCGADGTALGFYPKEFAKNGPFDGAKADTQLEVLAEAAEAFLGTDDGFRQRSTEGMKQFLHRRDTATPFFLYLATELPHGTGTRTMEQRPGDDALYRDAYRDQRQSMRMVPGYVAEADVRVPKLPREVFTPDFPPYAYKYIKTPELMREQLVRNAQTITGMDRLVARLRDRLRTLGRLENTIFVFTSDQGILYGEWGYGGKCLLYENAIRVPLIIHDPRPGAVRGVQVRDKLAVIPDLAPTILDLCGIEVPKVMQGRSLVPLMRGTAKDWRTDFFAECQINAQGYPIIQAVRGERWKYIRYWPTRFPEKPDFRAILSLGIEGPAPIYEELYDLESDPTEQGNLVQAAEHTAQLETMRRRCNTLQREALARDPNAPLPCGTTQQWKEDERAFYEASQID